MKLIKALRKLAIISAIASIAATQSIACIGITLTAADGSFVYGRTLEWGAST